MRAAGDDTPTPPEDPAALRALLLEALAKCDTLSAELGNVADERDALASQNERLRHLLLKLKRRQFGRKSERLPEGQLLFAFEEIEATLAANAAEAGKQSPALRDQQTKRRRSGRGRLPAHLPRVEVVLAPEATACPCCRGPLVEIGSDAAERLDVIPARFRVVATKRPKLACRACAGVVLQAPAPARLVEGGMPTEATVAHVLVSRYADHLPLYRQAQILARQGIEVGREVLADWAGTAAVEIMPVVRRMHELLLASPRLFAGETTMPVLDPGRGRTKKGFAWAIARDDRPWGGTDPPAVAFHYAPGRGAEHAKALLADYRGILQCDGYAAYKGLAAPEGVTLAFCWSHTIRTQSCDGQAGAATGIGAWLGHRDDMLDLDVVVMHDDALDDELQDRLPLGDARSLQPSGNPRAEGREAFKRRERALALFLQAAQLGVLLLGQSALGNQRLAPLGKLWEADHLRLVSLDQAAIGTLDALDPLLDLALRRAGRVLDSAGFGCEAFELRQQPFGVAKQAGDVVPD